MLDDFDDLLGDALAECLGLVRCPFKLAVKLLGGRVRELAILTTARELDSQFEWAARLS